MFEKIIAFFVAVINFFLGIFGLGGIGGPKFDCQTFFDISVTVIDEKVVFEFCVEFG